ncbi:hypothetical protein P168DRAFT_192672 [Aspergillus campestris IBT 28561]|uniref:Uncharacterized protein n=1 Tax=Aspergillus campestris (strain IBT 28561) TaxID=1392248 RepID=A0A2I1CYY9_ASPC2|nr:uncharacterized protein P168DRAFT_192672 [Aspergillus campestris IBT 28561]PKY02853.1 hypothetical protein P168DRAFT_192672 [Aspergillus campestris IBT 28561]
MPRRSLILPTSTNRAEALRAIFRLPFFYVFPPPEIAPGKKSCLPSHFTLPSSSPPPSPLILSSLIHPSLPSIESTGVFSTSLIFLYYLF